MKANVEISTLDSLLDNLVFADVSPDELIKLGENVISKLIKIAQFSIEYLLFSQEYVTNCCVMLDSNYKSLYDNYTSVVEIA